MVFPVADQKAIILVKLLVEVVPFMSVLEALLLDQGTNLLSTLMPGIYCLRCWGSKSTRLQLIAPNEMI